MERAYANAKASITLQSNRLKGSPQLFDSTNTFLPTLKTMRLKSNIRSYLIAARVNEREREWEKVRKGGKRYRCKIAKLFYVF